MNPVATDHLGIIAGRGVYPLLLASAARKQGVQRLFAIALRGETKRDIVRRVDDVRWMPLGSLDRFLQALRESGVRRVVMAGQITPRHLFHLRLDRSMRALLSALPERNADTIFGAVCARIQALDIEILPAWMYMRDALPVKGVQGQRAPDSREREDINLGWHIAKTVSGLNIGQTVVIKEGTVLAVEAFEGTDAAIRRAGRLGGRGAVVVKVAQQDHDMRFDIPVIGRRTLRVLRRAGVTALALEAGRTLLLEKEWILAAADHQGLALVAVDGPIPADGVVPCGRQDKEVQVC